MIGETFARRTLNLLSSKRNRTENAMTTDDPIAPTDSELIEAIAARRDKAAFEALFRRYAGPIKGVTMKSGADAGEADEAAQEAMLAVWRKAHTFDPEKASASAWIFAIARNRRIDLIRKSRRPEPDPNDPLFRQPPEPGAETRFAIEQRETALRSALASLTGAQREMVLLAFFRGLTHHEIAETTGTPLGTVKSRLRLAVGKLRTVLGDAFAEEMFGD